MRLQTSRKLADLRVVLLEPQATGPDPVYEVFTDLNDPAWVNKTVLAPGKIGQEYPKTFGHYHGVDVLEKYRVVEGEGVLLLQKKYLENGVWVAEKVEEVLLVSGKAGEEIIVRPEYGHSWSNVGTANLVLLDNWTVPHFPTDYAEIERLAGMAYYLVEVDGAVKAVPNPNYKDPPEPIWLSVAEYQKRAEAV